jgi:hypothetical protein
MRALPDPHERVWTIIKWCSACGHDRVLDHLLRTEGAYVTPDLLNGKPPPQPPTSDPNAPTASGYEVIVEHPPLHLAAAIGSAESAELLALAGADVKAADSKGNTAAGIAARKGFLDTVEVLTTGSPSLFPPPHFDESLSRRRNAQVLLRHGAGGSDFARLADSQRTRFGRKDALPLSFQAAAGGHVRVRPQALLKKAVLLLFLSWLFISTLPGRTDNGGAPGAGRRA